MNINRINNTAYSMFPNRTQTQRQTDTQPFNAPGQTQQQPDQNAITNNQETQGIANNIRQLRVQPQTQPEQPMAAENQQTPQEPNQNTETTGRAQEPQPREIRMPAATTNPRESGLGIEPAPVQPQSQQTANTAQPRQQYQTNTQNPENSPLINLFG